MTRVRSSPALLRYAWNSLSLYFVSIKADKSSERGKKMIAIDLKQREVPVLLLNMLQSTLWSLFSPEYNVAFRDQMQSGSALGNKSGPGNS